VLWSAYISSRRPRLRQGLQFRGDCRRLCGGKPPGGGGAGVERCAGCGYWSGRERGFRPDTLRPANSHPLDEENEGTYIRAHAAAGVELVAWPVMRVLKGSSSGLSRVASSTFTLRCCPPFPAWRLAQALDYGKGDGLHRPLCGCRGGFRSDHRPASRAVWMTTRRKACTPDSGR